MSAEVNGVLAPGLVTRLRMGVKAVVVRLAARGWLPAGLAQHLLMVGGLRDA